MFRAVLATTVLAAGVMFGAAPEAHAQNLVPCAREGGFCRVPYPTRVIYGAQGRNIEVFVRGGGIPCSNRAFGDPAPGRAKRCAFVARGGRGWDDDRRGPPRGYGPNRGFRDDDGYGGPPRRQDRGFSDDNSFDGPYRSRDVY